MMHAAQMLFARWNGWTRRSANRRIFAAMVTVGGLTFIVKMAATAKELFVAHRFGTSDALDAYLIALVMPAFFGSVLAGSFNAAFIPAYVQIREHQGREAAQKLFAGTMFLCLLLLVSASVLLALIASPLLSLIASGFGAEKMALTRSLYFTLLPILAISGLSMMWGAVLNAGERFALAAIAPIMSPLLIAALLLLRGGAWKIHALVAGTLGGLVLEAGLLAWSLRRQRLSVLPRWHGVDAATKQVMSQYGSVIVGGFLMNCTTLLDQSMAAALGAGSVSVLSYANKIVAFTLGVATMALGTAVLPHFSRMVARNDHRGLRHTLKTYSRLLLPATVAFTAIFIYFSEPLVRLLFQRGAFTAADTHLVGKVQALYLLQVPFYVMSIMIVRLISSLQANKILLWGAAISLALKIILNYAFMQWLGVGGIALSTSAVYGVSFGYLLLALLRLLKEGGDGRGQSG
jgi:putative peptidoglycan lipid II flippase